MITTHVLDTAHGMPAASVSVTLDQQVSGEWVLVGRGTTDEQGRASALTDDRPVASGTYRLRFDTGAYHRAQGVPSPLFPEVTVTFDVADAGEHYHIPLLLSPYGFTTYRGSR